MLVSPNAPERTRVVNEVPFTIPEPFSVEDVKPLAEKYEVNVEGLTKALNQSVVSLIAMQLAGRFRTAEKKETEEEKQAATPTNDLIPELIAKLDFTGTRSSGEPKPQLSPLEKEIQKHARAFINTILSSDGIEFAGVTTPVKVVGKDKETGEYKTPGEGEVSYEFYLTQISRLAEGVDEWTSNPDLAKLREDQVVKPAKAALKQKDALSKSITGVFSKDAS